MQNEKISVIVPVYNTQKYVKRCLDSLLTQTYRDLEILVVNDASPDNSEDIIIKVIEATCINELRELEQEDCFVRINFSDVENNEQHEKYLRFDRRDIENGYYKKINEIAKNIYIEEGSIDEINTLVNVSPLDQVEIYDEIQITRQNDTYAIKSNKTKIVYIRNIYNKGLFHARISGYEFATGSYIASVDSDDYLGIDYYRTLIKKSQETGADVVFSEFVKDDLPKGEKKIRTHGMQAIRNLDLQGNAILDYIFRTEGELSALWFVWNKLYKKELWDKCYSDFLQVEGHHIMLEDMMYGVILTSKANRYVWVDDNSYFYTVNETASTTNTGGYAKVSKNVSDVVYAFNFIENYLKKIGRYEENKDNFRKVKEKWSRTWYDTIKLYELSQEEKEHLDNQVHSLLPEYESEPPSPKDIYFYDLKTPWDSRLEMLKRKVCSSQKEIISFDIFDTLIVRPFFKPSDIFTLMDSSYEKMMQKKSLLTFSEMRIKAEKVARINIKQTSFEEVTLDEIYQTLLSLYDIPIDIANKLKNLEIELEIRFCQPRNKLYEIYELARFLGKKVIAVSDMYLPKEVIEKMLHKCGYSHLDNIYISSEYRLTKSNGTLYEKVLQLEGVKAEQVVHIGDNWDSDCATAQKYGIEAWRTAKTIDLLLNKVNDIDKKYCRAQYPELLERNSPGNFMRYMYAKEYFGIRCMLGIIANKLFDNPYLSYEPFTDFNRNPYWVGYAALGTHGYGIAKWLLDSCCSKNVDTIHFVARDGYLVKQLYDVLVKYIPNAPKSNYFYMSRKSFLPLSIETENDWWTINKYVTWKNKTPEEIIDYYQPIISLSKEESKEILFNNGILWEKPLADEKAYENLVKVLRENFHDASKIRVYREEMKEYLDKIFHKGDVMFDIGYSGRAQAMLANLMDYSMDAYYIHVNQDNALTYANKYDFNVYTYFDYTPALTGKVRELVQSEPAASCIGYVKNSDGKYEPKFEDSKWGFHNSYVINQMHQGAIDFTKDFLELFSDFLSCMVYRKTDVSFIHESFILKPKKGDMEIFKLFHFEDDLMFGKGYVQKRLIDIWNGDLDWQNMRTPTPVVQQKPVTQKKTAVAHAEVQKYQPYRIVDEAPYGKGRTKYYLTHDHIILQRHIYEKYGNGFPYRIFKAGYNVTKTVHHFLNGLNAVGNNKAKFKLLKEGKVLYNATSAYGLLCCILHKLKYHPNDKCELMLSIWRKDKVEKVRNSGIFNNVILWNDLPLRDISYSMDALLKNGHEIDYIEQEWRFFAEYEKYLPFNINEYKEIIIAGNTMPFGCYLARNEVPYSVIEDGAGLFSNPTLLLHNISSSYPLLEQYMHKKYKIFDGNKYCTKNYINKGAQTEKYPEQNTEDFRPVELLDFVSESHKIKIFDIFEVSESINVNNRKTCLLLTYPLAQREGLSINEEKTVYTYLADVFGNDCEEIHIKAHPDDRTDFSEIDNIKIINRKVLSELLWYETKTQYTRAISTVSTSLNNLLCIDGGLTFDAEFSKEYKNLLKYYIIAKLLKENYDDSTAICGIGLYDQMMKNILSYSDVNGFIYHNEDDGNIASAVAIIGKNASIDKLSKYETVICLEKPLYEDAKTYLIEKAYKDKKYSFVNILSEEIYISSKKELVLPDVINMKTTGIAVTVKEKRGENDND